MEKPLVSVVMSCYNHAEFVGKAIESVLRQTYENIEFIIADDGSADNSVEVIKQYQDPRIHFTPFEKNTNFGTIDFAYECARGKYVATICSDDIWQETLIEKYVAFLEENEEYGACFCKPQIINEQEELLDDLEVFKDGNRSKEEWFRLLYLKGNCICAPSMCVRRMILQQLLPIRFQFRQLQDYDLWMRLLQLSNIYIYPEKLVLYRKHDSGWNQNISAPTPDVVMRDVAERKYIMLDLMEKLDDTFFIQAFYNDLQLHPHEEGFSIECEKFGIMLMGVPVVPLDTALLYFYRHYDEKEFRESIENSYHISRKDFWNLAARDQWGMKEMVDTINKLVQERQLMYNELQKKEEEIAALRKML